MNKTVNHVSQAKGFEEKLNKLQKTSHVLRFIEIFQQNKPWLSKKM
jgi:hypothetical protein